MSFPKLRTITSKVIQKEFDSIYFVYGEEDYFHHEMVHLLENHVVDSSLADLNTDILYGSEVNGGEVLSACLALPMMSDKRLVIVHQFELLSFADVDRFISYIDNPEQQTVALFLANKINKNKKVFKSLLQKANCIEAKKITSEGELFHWLKSEFEKRQKNIQPEAIKLLYDNCGNNLYELKSNIEKIITFTFGEFLITDDHIEEIIGVSKEFNSYELQEAIISRDKSKSLSILKRLLDQGEDPIYLNSLIFYRFTKQWSVIQLMREKAPIQTMTSKLGLPPFIVKKYLGHANKFTIKQCNDSLKALKETDMKLKSTSTDAGQLLTFNIIKILSF